MKHQPHFSPENKGGNQHETMVGCKNYKTCSYIIVFYSIHKIVPQISCCFYPSYYLHCLTFRVLSGPPKLFECTSQINEPR